MISCAWSEEQIRTGSIEDSEGIPIWAIYKEFPEERNLLQPEASWQPQSMPVSDIQKSHSNQLTD